MANNDGLQALTEQERQLILEYRELNEAQKADFMQYVMEVARNAHREGIKVDVKDMYYCDNAKRIIDSGQYDAAGDYMDDDLREELHQRLAPCSELEFLLAYMTEHEKRFGEVWEIAKDNPIW